ncbi:MAG: fibronectin type III domain-containing protein [Woeseiaceae bacterium]
MSRNLKIFKGTVAGLILLVVVWLSITNYVIDPRKGIMSRGDLELAWQTPTENADSSPLTDLVGYTVYCWNAEGQRTETIVIDDPDQTSIEVQRLWPGTYQCAMSAVKSDGSQSVLSNVVTRSVP